ncbi:hypothetical protein BDV28DRAFT_128080 [Aspergillus coremiiformis]|uniref:GPI anchored protein n=1 Tax=Aspergillus coremiiformis TaxID=138285 RepID=A0A5N6ZGG6_9EURO|nr:hypothetical protein BDV28DRAFT_128080 [Aspergillus coremiiformis]
MTPMQFLVSLAMAGLVSANSSVTSMFLLGLDPQSLEASIIGNDATATTYSITCAPSPTTTASTDDNEDGYECGLGPGLTLTDISPTTIVEMNEKPNFSYTVNCSVAGTTSAVCTQIAGGPDANFPGTTIATVPQSEMVFVPVTITAGSITSASAAASATATAESTGKASSAAAAQTSPASGASSSAKVVSTGGMPQITGDAGMLFGGAVVALAAAVL